MASTSPLPATGAIVEVHDVIGGRFGGLPTSVNRILVPPLPLVPGTARWHIDGVLVRRIRTCPRCRSRKVRRSRWKTLLEPSISFLFLPYRCMSCYRRFWRLRWFGIDANSTGKRETAKKEAARARQSTVSRFIADLLQRCLSRR
jgi:hypothetical protein